MLLAMDRTSLSANGANFRWHIMLTNLTRPTGRRSFGRVVITGAVGGTDTAGGALNADKRINIETRGNATYALTQIDLAITAASSERANTVLISDGWSTQATT